MVEIFKKYCSVFACLLIGISAILIINIFRENLYNFEIKGLSKIVENISVNLAFDNKTKKVKNNNIEACFDS